MENLGKSTGECKNQHSNKFPKFLKVFGNLRKSSDVFGKIQKLSQSAFKKQLFSFFELFVKSSEIVGSLRKSSEVFGKDRKLTENSQNDLPTIFKDFRKFLEMASEVFGNARKTSETSENFRMYFEVYEKFYNIPISDTYGLKIRFKNFEL